MGSNQSKPMKHDSENAEDYPPASQVRSSSKKRKANDVVSFIQETSKKENALSQSQTHQSSPISSALEMNGSWNEKQQSYILQTSTCDNKPTKPITKKGGTRKNAKRHSKLKLTGETNNATSDSAKDDNTSFKMNDDVADSACSSQKHASILIQETKYQHLTINDQKDETELGADISSATSNFVQGNVENNTETRNRTRVNVSSTPVSASDFEIQLQTTTSLELPNPNILQTSVTVSSGESFMPRAVSTLTSPLVTPQASYSSLFSSSRIATSYSLSSSCQADLTCTDSRHAATSGQFSASGLESSTNWSTSASQGGYSNGNFAVESNAPVTESSSDVPYMLNGTSYCNSSSFRSNANQISNTTTNSATTYSYYESANLDSHTDISPSTTDVNSNITNGSYGLPNWSNLENDVVTDSLDWISYYSGDTLAQRLQEQAYLELFDRQSSAFERNRNNLDQNFITVRTSVGDTTTRISSRNITLSSHAGADLTDENMGIILERPKYPRYATLASRMQSFEQSWPVTNKISWEKLPEAGFVYTGTSDCVRCYYCNGGLREWLKNDCPWTEHARYYPHCPHVRQCKGDDFVRRVRNGTDDGAFAQNDESGNEMEIDTVAYPSQLPRDQDALKTAAEFIPDQKLLEKAVHYIKSVQGKSSFDAQELVGIAFEIDDGAIVCDFGEEEDKKCVVDEVSTDASDSDDGCDIEVDCGVLEEENRLLRERSLCKVCLDATACVLFLDCGHMIACAMCAPALKTCAVCRAEVKGTVRAMYATDR